MIEINGERYYTRKETAKLLNVSLATLTRWKREGILVPVKISPRKVFYRMDSNLQKLLGETKNPRIVFACIALNGSGLIT